MKLVELYQWNDTRKPLNTDISLLAGKEDRIPINDIEAWKAHTYGSCDLNLYDGGHFFINTHHSQIVSQIAMTLRHKLMIHR